ncbi:MAG: hypothetical protein IKO10_05235 [Lachnospiraceae bacterium]|nr:hypothetical protein [Lachnospiraceae bacterium]
MTTLEITLLMGGLAAFVISFFLPDVSRGSGEAGEGISREELEHLFDDEVELSRQKIDDLTKETLDYSMEKTERSLEKIANEKIMAVGEYSDSVLEQINQSHNQVVFLSDMLRKSKEELTELLNRADQTSKDANVRANEAYDLAGHAMKLAEDATDKAEAAGRTAVSAEEKMIDARRLLQETELRKAAAEAPEEELYMEEQEPTDAVEVPAEIFEELVSEFALEDADAPRPEDAREAGAVAKRGAEERLQESLSAFRDSLKETEEDTEAVWNESDRMAFTGSNIEKEDVKEIFGDEAETVLPENNSDSFMGLSEEELREMGLQSNNGWLESIDEPEEEIPAKADIFETLTAAEELAASGDAEEAFDGLSEEEKMEALLRAATEELAADVSSVTGISEARWEPSEEEKTESADDTFEVEETESEPFDAESEASEEYEAEPAADEKGAENAASEFFVEAEGTEAADAVYEANEEESESVSVEESEAPDETVTETVEAEPETFDETEPDPLEETETETEESDSETIEDAETENAEEKSEISEGAEEPDSIEAFMKEFEKLAEEPETKARSVSEARSKKSAEKSVADTDKEDEEYPDQLTIEAVMKEFEQMTSEAEDGEENKAPTTKKSSARKPQAKKTTKSATTGRKRTTKKADAKEDGVSLQFEPGEETTKNNNERILEMHRMGRSDMAIAKDLGMGIGEVKLIIALNEIS